MHSRLLISLSCAGAVALACGSLKNAERSAHAGSRHARATGDSSTKIDGNFAVKAEAHALHFAFDVANKSDKHVEVDFPNGQQYEFAVMDSVGREVYRWSTGRMFTQSVQNRLIDGGDHLKIEERVEATLPKGRYVAMATLRSSNYPMKQSSTFELR